MSTSSLGLEPLFSTIITLYTLFLLYSPSIFLGIFSSAVMISTSTLLLSLLRLGANQKSNQLRNLKEQNQDSFAADHNLMTSDSSGRSGSEADSVQVHTDSFVEWDVSAPLEVIHEAYEGEEEENEDVLDDNREAPIAVLERYDSLSKFYPETDSDTSSEDHFPGIREWELPENPWEMEANEELIEIELEEDLIEIDLNPVNFPAT